MKRLLSSVIFIAALGLACGAPSSLKTPEGVAAWKADQVVQRLGEFQNVVIDGQRTGKVKTADARTIVSWISGDSSATPPKAGALDVLSHAPTGWKEVVQRGWIVVRPAVVNNASIAGWAPTIDSLVNGVQ
jgi:hypothetical protein